MSRAKITTLPPLLDVREAEDAYTRAIAALRDAKRLLDRGFAEVTSGARHVLDAATEGQEARGDHCDIAVAIEMVIGKEARDLLDLYDRHPLEYPNGQSAERALMVTRKAITSRYRRGKCSLCKGRAALCAPRHATGRSCA